MEGKSINELYTDNFDNKNGKIPAKRMRKMPEGMQGKMPEGMQGKMPEGMQGKMPEGMQGMMQMMDFKDPKILLKMANDLDSQIHGVSAGKISQGGEGGGMGGNGGDTGKGMPQKMVLGILSSPMIPKDVSEQFSPSVKLLIDEHKKLQIHNASSGEVFNNLSFKISAGKTIAIVGETGAGKTTLIKLLPRFYDIQSGEIMVDGINVKDILKEDLRSIIGMVPQDSFLFSDTIMNNLYYGVNDDVMRDGLQDELIRISEFLGLNNFVQKMPLKYDTKLLENASNISVGQRQLIAFARVLMLDPRILILDEATSSVDPYTETLIQDALDKARKGRTTIIIAHRLSTIKNADEIFVIENGNIIERGSHNELMSKNGAYAKLVKMQESNS
jgi:ABC-type multidrug transport system fused ATPase/permease subunit